MQTIFKLFFILLLCVVLPINSNARTISIDVEASGTTRQDAINNALKEALHQVTGVLVNAKDMSSVFSQDESISIEDSSEGNLIINAVKTIKNTQSGALSKTKGYISSYRVLKHKKKDDLDYVNLTVDIEKYEAPGEATDSKRNLVISKFDTKGSYLCAGSQMNTGDIKNDINQILVENFTNTRRFNILDRDNFDVYQEEKNIILSDDAALKEISRLGNIIGTDYIITGNIKNISIIRNIEQIDLTGESIETRTASITMDYRIILISNMNIKKTDTINIKLGNQILSKKPFNCSSIRYELLKEAANKIVNSAVEAIYPALVIKVSDDNIYINQAEGTVKVGDLWDIFSLGEALIDPYSREKLGEEETLVATIKISEIKPKFSIGKIVNGNLKDISEKQICRRKEENINQNKGKKDKVGNKPEVFKLPFDN